MPTVNLEAEKHLLGCILKERNLIKEISLLPEHFSDPNHQRIYEVMKEIERKDEPVTTVTIYTHLGNEIQYYGGVEYLHQLSNGVPSVDPYKTYEKYVMDAWKLKESERIASQLREGVHTSADTEIISDSISKLSKIEEQGYDDDFDIHSVLDEMDEDFKKIEGSLTGIETGYMDLNRLTYGWQNGDLVIVAARPSVGKTAFALNMAEKACERQACVSIFSLEMSDKSLLKRMIAAKGNIDATKLRNPKMLFNSDDKMRYRTSRQIIKGYNLHIYDNASITVQEIRSKLRKLKRQYPDQPHICFVDYLQLIRGSGRENRVQEVAEISRGLKLIARDLDMPVVVLSQLSRASEQRQNKRPVLSDLRESGSIEQDADIVMFLHRDDYYDQESSRKNIIEIIIGKQRNGPVGTVELVFLKEYNKFVEFDRRVG